MNRPTILAALLLATLLSACAPAATPTPLPTATPRATDTPLPTLTPTETAIPTNTPSPAPTSTRTATPRPTATPTPATETSVIYTDDFSKALCVLTTVSDANREFACADGEYTMLSKAEKRLWWVFYREPYDDFVLQVDGRIVSGTGRIEYGVVLRMASDGNKAFLFGIEPGSRAYIGEYYARPDWQTLAGPETSEAIKPGTEWNRLKVIAQASQLALYINDQFIDTVSDANLTSGTLGLYISNREANGKVAFDNVQVSRINRQLALPAGKERPPTPTPLPPVPAGMGGVIVTNWMGVEMNYTIGGQLYKIPANGTTVIHLAPGRHKFSLNTATGLTAACETAQGCTVEVELGRYYTQSWGQRR